MEIPKNGNLHLGLAVWGYPAWLGNFLPANTPKSQVLQCFAERVSTVEGNDSFYGVPSLATLVSRAARVPASFRFCPKVPQAISHADDLSQVGDALLTFGDLMRDGLGQRLGPLFLQLPPRFDPRGGPALARLLNAYRRHTEHPLFVEVRHTDWFEGEASSRLDTLLQRLGLGRVVLDTRPIYLHTDITGGYVFPDPQAGNPRKKPQLPVHPTALSQQAFVRYIANPRLEVNQPFFDEWVERIAQWLSLGCEVWFFVHCPDEAQSPGILRALQQQLLARGIQQAALPWDTIRTPVQRQLF